MKDFKTILTLTGLIIFIFSIERFYTEALSYNPSKELKIKEREKENPLSTKRGTSATNQVEARLRPLNSLFGIEKVKKTSPQVSPPPPANPPAVTPPPPETPPQLVLKGIILEPDGRLRAFIEINGKKIVSLRKGEGIENLTVTDIKERSVSLRWKDQIVELSIEQKRR
jgi:type II secretory pathway component PulC